MVQTSQRTPGGSGGARFVRAGTPIVVAIVAGVAFFMWLAGAFHERIEPSPPQAVLEQAPADAGIITVELTSVSTFEQAVGSIRPVRETTVGSQLMARVVELVVDRAGTAVEAGDLLARLDDSVQRAELERARAEERSARAALSQAENDLTRAATLFEQGLITREEHERAATRRVTSVAAVEGAEQAAAAANASLSHAMVLSPITGIMIDKHVQAGDLVVPGHAMFTLHDPTHMQLVAGVRESLAARLEVGSTVDVEIDSLDLQCEGHIDQIVPRAELGTRSFDVKVSGPCPPGIRSGMFGRLSIKTGETEEILVPETAILQIGQLDMVQVVVEGERLLRRFVRLGRRVGDRVQVLSGLAAGERILARAAQ